MLKRQPHAPAHLFVDNTSYFITGAIYHKRPLINDPALKQKFIEILRKYFDKFNWKLYHWVIFHNHYHIMGKSHRGKDLSEIIRNIHRSSAILVSEATHCEKPVWWNFWDYCPRNEKDYMTRLNYLLFNPIKHGYTDNLREYPFSSFQGLYSKTPREKLEKQFRDYPDYKTLVPHEANEDDF